MGFSQNGEDEIIQQFFLRQEQGTGILLDIGAHDGATFSNSKLFTDAGWAGLMIEPHAPNFEKLKKCYLEKYKHLHCTRSTIIGAPYYRFGPNILLNAAVVDAYGPDDDSFTIPAGEKNPEPIHCHKRKIFSDTDGVLAVVAGDHMDPHRKAHPESDFPDHGECFTISVEDLLKRLDIPYNFISIDAEGLTTKIFMAMPWEKMQSVQCVCVERDDQFREPTVIKMLASGFQLTTITDQNLIFTKPQQ